VPRSRTEFAALAPPPAAVAPFSKGAMKLSRAAVFIGVCRRELQDWVKDGRLPSSKPGRAVLVCRATLVAILREHAGKVGKRPPARK
jgi:excisionase family DNA binding protein